VYEKYFKAFKKYIEDKGCNSHISETVITSYFDNLSKKYSPSTLWTIYSCLKKDVTSKLQY